MARPLDVCIRGAGIVGRSLALLLAGERLRVGLVTSHSEPSGAAADVRAYALNARSRALLESVRVWPDEASATAVKQMLVHGDDGGVVNFNASAYHASAMAWIVDVAALQARLIEATRFQPLIEELAQPAAATLTIVCEGRTSRTREEFGVEFDISLYGQHAVAARVRCEQPHDQIARQWFSNGEILAFLPLDGPQGNSVALVWSVTDEHAQTLMSCSVPEFEAALKVASQSASGALKLISERAIWPLQQAHAAKWVGASDGGSWVLAGDAAHTVHPLSGQGLNLGLADAGELVTILKERPYWREVSDMKLLRQYERTRKAEVTAMGAGTDALQQLFAQNAVPWPTIRNWGMRGFNASGIVKKWVAQQAMGIR